AGGRLGLSARGGLLGAGLGLALLVQEKRDQKDHDHRKPALLDGGQVGQEVHVSPRSPRQPSWEVRTALAPSIGRAGRELKGWPEIRPGAGRAEPLRPAARCARGRCLPRRTGPPRPPRAAARSPPGPATTP